MARLTKNEKFNIVLDFSKRYKRYLNTKKAIAEGRVEIDGLTDKVTTTFKNDEGDALTVKYKTSHSTKVDIDGFCAKYGIEKKLFEEFTTVTYFPVFDGIE